MWIRVPTGCERFIRFHKLRHPKEMNSPEVEAFLTHLAVQQNVSPSTQNQALSALLFLYRNVLNIELTSRIDAVRAQCDKRLPVVLTKAEVQTVIGQMTGLHQMMAKLLYGSGIRLMEGLRLRVKDVDFDRHQLLIRDTKGNEDRVTMLPQSIAPALREHLLVMKQQHDRRATCPISFALETFGDLCSLLLVRARPISGRNPMGRSSRRTKAWRPTSSPAGLCN